MDAVKPTDAPLVDSETQAVLAGLQAPQKTLNPKYFYDQRGSALFEQITRLPEYYPTRTEVSLLQRYAGTIAELLGDSVYMVEPGAGNCEKVRYLLNDLRPACYIPMDISLAFLQQAAEELASAFPWLKVNPQATDFSQGLQLPDIPARYKPVVFYPGSTIGNFEPSQAVGFLRELASQLTNQGGILLGVDLQKDPALLNAAYNDSQGITARFNRNALNHLNKQLGSNFDPTDFEHQAFYNNGDHRIEMHLRCRRDHHIRLHGQRIDFRRGETIHTENSYKYTLDGIAEMAQQAGLQLRHSWVDEQELFSISFLANCD